MNLQQHALSAAFPAMSADDFESLKENISNIGVQNPITLYEGMVIDGWHRYRAATDLGMDCPTVELQGWIDPRDFVRAANDARRHMTQAARELAIVAVYAWHPANRSKKEVDTECPLPKTNAELAQIAGVHANTIKQAKAVHAKAVPEVVEAVQLGGLGLPKAAAIANLVPVGEQASAINKPLPKPKKQTKNTPAPEDAPEDSGPTEEELAAQTAAEAADRELVATMLESDDALAALAAENKRLKAEVSQLKIARDGYMRGQSEAVQLGDIGLGICATHRAHARDRPVVPHPGFRRRIARARELGEEYPTQNRGTNRGTDRILESAMCSKSMA